MLPNPNPAAATPSWQINLTLFLLTRAQPTSHFLAENLAALEPANLDTAFLMGMVSPSPAAPRPRPGMPRSAFLLSKAAPLAPSPAVGMATSAVLPSRAAPPSLAAPEVFSPALVMKAGAPSAAMGTALRPFSAFLPKSGAPAKAAAPLALSAVLLRMMRPGDLL